MEGLHRFHLTRRISVLLGCKANELPPLSIGALANYLYLLIGDSTSDLGNFQSSFIAMLDILGRDETWAEPAETEEASDEEKPAEEKPLEEIN
jgi:hypothetical protein